MAIQSQIERFGRLYVASSQVSRLAMRCQSREELFQGVVRILVDVGKFALSFVSWLDPATQQLIPVCRYGDSEDYADRAQMFVDQRAEGQGPAGIAFRSGTPYVCNDFLNDASTVPWREAAREAGWKASGAFPIVIGGSSRGVLSVYVRDAAQVAPDQVQLLQQVALDVAFGIENLTAGEERRRAEESVRQGDERHRIILKTAMDGFWLVDMQGRLLEVNETYCRMSGYREEELLTLTISDLAADQTEEQTAVRMERLMKLGEARYESRHRRKDGSVFDVEASVQYRDIEGGRLIVFLRDISERKQAENALRASEQKFRDLFDSAPVAYHELDKDGVVRRVNRAECALFGYAASEMLDRPVWTFVLEEEQTASRAMLARKLSGEVLSHPVQRRFVRRDGRQMWLEIHDVLVRGESGEIEGLRSALIDVTDRKKAEEALRESESRLQLLISASNIGLWDWDLATNEVRFSREWKSQIGYAEDEISDSFEEWQSHVHPDDLDATLGKVHAYLDNPQGRHAVEFRFRHKNGTYRWINSEGTMLCDAAGKPVRMLGCHLDVTEAKLAEEALRASEMSYRSLFDNMVNYLCQVRVIFDGERVVDWEYLAGNRAFHVRRGGENLVGKRLTEISPHINRTDPGVFEILSRVVRTGMPEACEIRIEATKEWYNLAVYRQGPDQVMILYDLITERKRAEESLRTSQRLLAESQRVAHLGSWAIELPGYQLSWSEEAYRVWGVSPETFVPSFEAFLSLIHPDDGAAMNEWTRACLANENPADLEFRALRSDGTFRILNGRGVLLHDEENRPVRMAGTIQDITERKRVEAEKTKFENQFHQAQKMESVGRLAGGVAHDFNNLLTVINGYSDMMLSELRHGDPLRDSAAEIIKAGQRAAGLTRQLLAFSRKQILAPRKLDVNLVVENMRPMLERLVGEDIEMRVVLSAASGRILADPNQLEQVLMNLVVNGRDAMPGTGQLLIETGHVERNESFVRLHAEARAIRYVMLAVSDTGEGMDEETKARIFEPFFTTKDIGKGTGLGLATVQGVVAQSGGYIEVYSEKGRGTTFKIYLPALTDEDSEMPAAPEVRAKGGTETILIVEDQADVRKLTAAVLKRFGYRVIPAENADDALLFCEREPVDLVLTDVVMPHMSGRELADRLEGVRPGLKVLFMSGYTGNVIEHHRVLEQDSHFIQKPFTPEELAGKVRSVLNAGRVGD